MFDDAFHTDCIGYLVVKLGVESCADSGGAVITAVIIELHVFPEVFGDDSGGIFAIVDTLGIAKKEFSHQFRSGGRIFYAKKAEGESIIF